MFRDLIWLHVETIDNETKQNTDNIKLFDDKLNNYS